MLALEIDVIFGLVADGAQVRVRDRQIRAVWSWSPRARLLALGPSTADDAAAGLPIDEQHYAPGEVPRVLARLGETLGAEVEGGPTYVFPEDRAIGGPDAALPVIVSDVKGEQAAERLMRPADWEPGEWSELITGQRGEWAMAVHGGSPVSICFSPAANSVAAEAGIWTREDFRGRRLAPAVVAAWSRRERRNREVLFYSTSAGNHASRSVARTLGLRPLGWLWKLL
ncbi:GNAT family N-acetyltransferase [Saccharopolyspora erythraea]|uniref:GNAT family N-acetyltransferase n=1 Tax=Saccharopolyspora erythraea TaxID=1836 RepID=UPI0020139239|nr:GNAT family N-acetyltransferase [Saccharopolyspora erythraea]